MAKIFLDAGHNYSGGDTGAIGNGLLEQNVTWEITSRLAKLLRNAGQIVIESRPLLTTNIGTNLTESINGRIAMANSSGADLLACIHADAFNDPSANGTEVWICKAGGMAEKLANFILTSLVSAIGTTNRGVKTNATDYGVLRDTIMPAVLIETAFISNAEDAKKLVQYDVIANAIFTGIMNYLGMPIVKPVTDPVPVSTPTPVITYMIVNTKVLPLWLNQQVGGGKGLALMPKNSQVELLEKTTPLWYKVNYKGTVGYASTQYLK